MRIQADAALHALRVAAAYCTLESQAISSAIATELKAGRQPTPLSHEQIGERMAAAALAGLQAGWNGEPEPDTTPPPAEPEERPLPPKLVGIRAETTVGILKALSIVQRGQILDTHPAGDEAGGLLIGFVDGMALRIAGRAGVRFAYGQGIWEDRRPQRRADIDLDAMVHDLFGTQPFDGERP